MGWDDMNLDVGRVRFRTRRTSRWYKSIALTNVCFGHHRDDVQMTLISNWMNSHSLLILNGMRFCCLLSYLDKGDIIWGAHRFSVSYFTDTILKWSNLGQLITSYIFLGGIWVDGYCNKHSVFLTLRLRNMLSSCICKIRLTSWNRSAERQCGGGRLWSAFESAVLHGNDINLPGVSLDHGRQHKSRQTAEFPAQTHLKSWASDCGPISKSKHMNKDAGRGRKSASKRIIGCSYKQLVVLRIRLFHSTPRFSSVF